MGGQIEANRKCRLNAREPRQACYRQRVHGIRIGYGALRIVADLLRLPGLNALYGLCTTVIVLSASSSLAPGKSLQPSAAA